MSKVSCFTPCCLMSQSEDRTLVCPIAQNTNTSGTDYRDSTYKRVRTSYRKDRSQNLYPGYIEANNCNVVDCYRKANPQNAATQVIVVSIDAKSGALRLTKDEARILTWDESTSRYESYSPKEFMQGCRSQGGGSEQLTGEFIFILPNDDAAHSLHFEFGSQWTLLSLDPWLGARPIAREDIRPPLMFRPRNSGDMKSHNASNEEPKNFWRSGSQSSTASSNVPEEHPASGSPGRRPASSNELGEQELNILSVIENDGVLDLWISLVNGPQDFEMKVEVNDMLISASDCQVHKLAPNVITANLKFSSKMVKDWTAERIYMCMPGMNKRLLNNWLVEQKSTEKCVLCSTNRVNATFVHGITGHEVCCIDCARRITEPSFAPPPAPCPVCRKPIDRVIEIFH